MEGPCASARNEWSACNNATLSAPPDSATHQWEASITLPGKGESNSRKGALTRDQFP